MEALKKFRKSAVEGEEIKDTFDELRLKKIPITLWQGLDNNQKNIKGAIVTSSSKIKNEVTFAPLDGAKFDFAKDGEVFIFAPLKGLFTKTRIEFLNSTHLAIAFPKVENIRLAEQRNLNRLVVRDKTIHVILRKKDHDFTVELVDLSNNGIGVKLQMKDRWNFSLHEKVILTRIGSKESLEKIEGEVIHISNPPNKEEKRVLGISVMGVKFSATLSEVSYYHFMEELA